MLGSTINQKSALSAAYAELGRELTSGKLKSVGSYTLGKVIGEGTYGKVRLGTHRLTGTRVAIKQVPKMHSATLTREIHHHRRLHHPNVMQLYEVMATESYIWMVTELCAGGELYDYLVERSTMPEPEARRIFGQLCLAVAYVHDRGIVHRDLKLENVLLDERCNVKVGDFGFTREYEAKKLMETFCGTTGYAAPEMLAGRKYTGQEVDIWSLGVILYALLCGALPFDDDDDNVMKSKIVKGEYDLPEELSEESRSLITSILQQDPCQRPSIKYILNHPWFHKTMITTPMSTVEEDEDEVSQQGGFFSKAQDKEAEIVIVGPTSTATALANHSINGDVLPRVSLSGFSDASFVSAKSKSDSESSDRQSNRTETTQPTTEEEGDEEMHDVVSSDTFPNLSATERGAALALHRNESQSTLRRQGSGGSDASRKASIAVNSSSKAATSLLSTHHEAPISNERPQHEEDGSTLFAPQSASLEKRGSQTSSRGQHHRTPSRSKRVSVGSLSEPIPPILDYRPTDYLSLLEQSTPAMFSTVIEQNILHQLSCLGMDVGQIVHSVINEACDASGAMWWILKKKLEERQDSHFVYSPLSANLPLTPLPPPPPPPKEVPRSQRSSRSASPASNTLVLPASNIVKPLPVYASQGSLALTGLGHASNRSTNEAVVNARSPSPSQSQLVESPVHTPLLAVRPQDRNRASSFSFRLSNALTGKDKGSKKVAADSNTNGDAAERSRSPVEALMSKMSGNSPIAPSRSDKEKYMTKEKKKKTTTKSMQASRVKEADDHPSERTSSSSQSSPMRSGEDVTGRLAMSNSIDTFTTLSSNHGSVSDVSPARSKGRSSFLSTFRTWFEDKDKAVNGKQKKQQKRNPLMSSNAAHPAAVHVAHGAHGLANHTASRNNSIRRISASGPYPPSTRSPRHTLSHRGSLSRRSSSGSTHPPHLSMATPRPKASRRPSAGSITPTATVEDLAYALPYHHRGSRPSSAQSARRSLAIGNGLHGKSGSASSSKSMLKQQQQQQSARHGYTAGSLNGGLSRRSSLDGGTVVRRHRRYPSPSPLHPDRSDSGHSRPTTPSKLRHSDEGIESLALGLHSPRPSLDLDHSRGRASPLQTPRVSSHGQNVLFAHRSSRSTYKPSSSSSLHNNKHDWDMIDEPGEKKIQMRAWRRSWGKPPPFWAGPVDAAQPAAAAAADATESARNKPKLRNVFADKESDDDWEDEEEEPVYAGGLGQLDSSYASQSWAEQSKAGAGKGASRLDGMPGHLFGSSRYAGVRSLFQPPSLGRETTPRAWTTSDGAEGAPTDEPKENGSADAPATSAATTSRVRAAAPAFKGADILEEDEEEDE